ncbi:TPA: glycosyltransferase [Candidatus Saccharibacteria bacterium]|nr:glycosyltransferase [Candidatus Saccharibacteria bacterium]HIO87252.1 glycosyltransferase [Candidatus Saccharibacteria bacterium]
MVKKKQATKKPLLSIIIPTLNEEHYIGLLLKDLTQQTFTDFEVIVSDSSSDDATLEVAKSFNNRLDLRTTVVERMSAGHGRNGGAKIARGNYYIFLDADIRIKPNFVKTMMDHRSAHNADMMTTNYRISGWNLIDKSIYKGGSDWFKKQFQSKSPLMSGACMFVTKELHKKVHGFKDELTVGEDVDYARRVAKHSKRPHFVDGIKVTASNRRMKQDGRMVNLLRNFQWMTGKKLGLKKVDTFEFGHYGKNKKIRWITRLLIVVVSLVFIIFLIGNSYSAQGEQKFGVSFSIPQAEQLGLDWQQTLEQSASQLPIPHYRLMSYWDRTEPSSGEYDFTEIDTQLDILSENQKTATLVVGLRQPRWPECHTPNWLESLPETEQRKQELQFIEAAVQRYRFNATVTSWQLENESANRNFGECPSFDAAFHEEKYQLINQLSQKPISINTSNQSGWPLREPTGDRTGFSVYKEAHFDAFNKTWSWDFWYVPSWWHGFRAQIVQWQHGTDAFIHELQTEPWPPETIAELSKNEVDRYFSPDELERNINYAQQTGMKEIWLWGLEFWYWYAQEFDDSSYLEQVIESVQ